MHNRFSRKRDLPERKESGVFHVDHPLVWCVCVVYDDTAENIKFPILTPVLDTKKEILARNCLGDNKLA